MLRYVALFVLVSASLARADDVCNLQRTAVLDSRLEGDIHLWLPVKFGTRTTRLLLDTGGGWSVMRAALAKELGLKLQRLRTVEYVDVAGGRTKHYVTVPRFVLGDQLVLGESDFIVDPDEDSENIDVYGGTMGVERLSDFDVEIDNVTKTVTLWRSDKFCSGRLVRWAEKWVEIPYTFNNEIIETKVKVGDERIKATFDTGSTRTLLDLGVAKRVFGVEPGSPGVEKANEITMPTGKKLQFYTYRVPSMKISDLTFWNVDVYLGDYEDTPLVIGMREIATLHLYIAPKRKMIYATEIEKVTHTR